MNDYPKQILEALGEDPNGITTAHICKLLGVSSQELGDSFEHLLESKQVLGFAGLWFRPDVFSVGQQQFIEALTQVHTSQPRILAHPRERIVHLAGLTWAGKPLDRILGYLEEHEIIRAESGEVRLSDFNLELSPQQQMFLNRVITQIEEEGINVSPPQRLAKILTVPPQAVVEILRLGTKNGSVIELSEGVYYTRKSLDAIRHQLQEAFGQNPFTLDSARDTLASTRKYLVPIFDYFDEVGITARDGNERVLAVK